MYQEKKYPGVRSLLSRNENDFSQIQAVVNHAVNNDKLLALRDKSGKLLAVGLSLQALQTVTSKTGFKYYQVLKKSKPISTSDVNQKIKDNNYCTDIIIYDVAIEIYEGKIKHNNSSFNKIEDYWYNCYEYYLNNKDSFCLFDLINKKTTKKIFKGKTNV
jgi:hypothetical protein